MIATDHAPHSAEEKGRGLEKSAMGIVGLETAFPLLYTYLVKPGVISMERLMELLHDAPCRRFNIPTDTGFTVFDLNDTYRDRPGGLPLHGQGNALYRLGGSRPLPADSRRAKRRVWYDEDRLLKGEMTVKQTTLTVTENTRLADGIYRLRLAGDTSAITAPGQFVNLKLSGFFLRRPISVCDWDERRIDAYL